MLIFESGRSCPCCSQSFVNIHEEMTFKKKRYFAKCTDCELRTDVYDNWIDAKNAWENREFTNWSDAVNKFIGKVKKGG